MTLSTYGVAEDGFAGRGRLYAPDEFARRRAAESLPFSPKYSQQDLASSIASLRQNDVKDPGVLIEACERLFKQENWKALRSILSRNKNVIALVTEPDTARNFWKLVENICGTDRYPGVTDALHPAGPDQFAVVSAAFAERLSNGDYRHKGNVAHALNYHLHNHGIPRGRTTRITTLVVLHQMALDNAAHTSFDANSLAA